MRESYNRDYVVGTRRSRTVSLTLLAAAAVAAAAFAVWLSPGGGGGQALRTGNTQTQSGVLGAVGTAGEAEGAGQNSGPSAAGIIHDLDTITGANDGHALVGRRVELRVPINQHINDVAFWVGTGDSRLLVVISRDTRDGAERQRGEGSASGVRPVRAGETAVISGTIERVPYAEAMYSWGLTTRDRSELMDRRIYLRADNVTGS